MTDAVLNRDNGYWDFNFNDAGQIEVKSFFDTSILRSIYGERRASPDEVPEPQYRRGWIGNDANFEAGSKLWLLHQSRLTRTTINRIQDEVEKALSWLVDDGFAVSIDEPSLIISSGRPVLTVTIRRSKNEVDTFRATLWDNTGQ